MPNWNAVLAEVGGPARGPCDAVRLKYLTRLRKHTGRNVLVYYSGWLQKPDAGFAGAIDDADKTGFMTCSHRVNRDKGLDLLLHTPGGDVAATESIIDYLRSLYGGNIRAIVPQMAMSGGTLIALSCREILMGRQSSLGPVDPQIQGMPAQGILEEFQRAVSEITTDPRREAVWRPILAKYWPTLITSCQHAVNWSEQLLRHCLGECMFANLKDDEKAVRIDAVAAMLGNQSVSKSHNRHISQAVAQSLGLKIVALENDDKLQDLVLTLHHALTITFSQTAAIKIIENDRGVAYIQQIV